jgi:hypothetical protein
MLVPLLLDLGGAPPVTFNASISAALPVITVLPMRPLWVSENPQDIIMVTPNPTPVGSYQ